MITIRPSAERGHFRSDWLDSWHSFSFDTYHDPRHMGFRSLRVINEDRVQPAHGFPLHPHANMEILTFIVEGSLKHEDDMGNSGVIGPCEMQRITAGTGIRHSEYNPSDREAVHLLQIWIIPERQGLSPSYEQKRFTGAGHRGLYLLASRDGRDGSITVHQDIALYAGVLTGNETAEVNLRPGRHAWLQMIAGDVKVTGKALRAGDGAAVSDERQLRLETGEKGSFLLFDLG